MAIRLTAVPRKERERSKDDQGNVSLGKAGITILDLTTALSVIRGEPTVSSIPIG